MQSINDRTTHKEFQQKPDKSSFTWWMFANPKH